MPTLAEDLYGRIIDILCSYFLLAGSTLLQVSNMRPSVLAVGD